MVAAIKRVGLIVLSRPLDLKRALVLLDLNNPEFQANLLKLEKQQAWAVLQTLRLLQAMTWSQVEQSKGRTVGFPSHEPGLPCGGLPRDGEWPRLLSLHPDHDSTYRCAH